MCTSPASFMTRKSPLECTKVEGKREPYYVVRKVPTAMTASWEIILPFATPERINRWPVKAHACNAQLDTCAMNSA